MRDYSLITLLALAIGIFLFFSLSRDKNVRSRFIGDRSYFRQANFMFEDGTAGALAFLLAARGSLSLTPGYDLSPLRGLRATCFYQLASGIRKFNDINAGSYPFQLIWTVMYGM